jgi:hypothetical protein
MVEIAVQYFWLQQLLCVLSWSALVVVGVKWVFMLSSAPDSKQQKHVCTANRHLIHVKIKAV